MQVRRPIVSKIASNFTCHLMKVGKVKQFKKVSSDFKTILMTDLDDLHFLGLSVKLFAACSCCVSECLNWVWQVKQVDFFCDKIVTIRHELDTVSITDAPVLPLLDDAIITCELSEFFPTSEDELSGLVKKIAAKCVLLILYLLLFQLQCQVP